MTSADLLIKNGTVITAGETFPADIAIKDGKIAQVASSIPEGQSLTVIDASNRLVLPGALDAHVHLQLPVGKTISADTYESGTRAAACGGVTTVFDFAIQQKGQGLIAAVEQRRKLCSPQACIDYAFHTVITDVTPATLAEIRGSIEYGVPSFKLYMVYKSAGLMVNDEEIVAVLKKAKETGALVAVHAEDNAAIEQRTKELLSAGKTGAWYHYESRPEDLEAEADCHVIKLANEIAVPLYIVHLANKTGLEEVARARRAGFKIIAETCIHYLEFTNEVYRREDGRNWVCSPAIKGVVSREALWAGINSGDISVVATDHCPFQSYEKDWGINDFSKIPNGCMGVENLYPYMLSQANRGLISLNKAVEVCSTNVAKIFGCYPKKGCIAVGSDADLVIYDPKRKFIISKDNMHSNVDYTIWEGVALQGYPEITISRGRIVFKNNEFLGQPGYGKFVKCTTSQL